MKPGKNKQVVLKLIDALSSQDGNRVQSFFSDKSTVHAGNGDVFVGQQAIWDAILNMHGRAEQVDWQIDQVHETEQGLVEAVGMVRVLISDQWRYIEVNGAFEVSGCKITQWQ